MAFPAFLSSVGGQAAIQGGFSVGGNLFSAREAKKARRYNRNMYRENRDWEEEMSNTEWQRGVADMLKAGINPMVAFSQGGASTPTSAAVQSEPISEMSGIMNSGKKISAGMLETQQQLANIELTRNQAYKTFAEGNSAAFLANPEIMGSGWDTQQRLLKEQINESLKRQDLTEAQAKQIEEMLPALKAASLAQTRFTDQQTSSAKQTQQLQEREFPEADATAAYFSSMLGENAKNAGAIKKLFDSLLQTIRFSERKGK